MLVNKSTNPKFLGKSVSDRREQSSTHRKTIGSDLKEKYLRIDRGLCPGYGSGTSGDMYRRIRRVCRGPTRRSERWIEFSDPRAVPEPIARLHKPRRPIVGTDSGTRLQIRLP